MTSKPAETVQSSTKFCPSVRLIIQAVKLFTVNGFTLEQIYDTSKPTALQLYSKFLQWAIPRGNILAGHNVGSFDVQFLKKNHVDYGGEWPFKYNYLDLHSVYFAKYGESLSLHRICESLGVEPEPVVHNALTGAQKICECLKVLLKSQI